MCYTQGDSDDQLSRGRLVDDLGGGLDVAQLAGGEVGGRDGPEVTQLHKLRRSLKSSKKVTISQTASHPLTHHKRKTEAQNRKTANQ